MDITKILESMVSSIVTEVSPQQIILFGSYATDQATSTSDVDLLIIEKEPFRAGRSRRKELGRILRVLMPFDIPKDVIIYDEEEIKVIKDRKNHVVNQALSHGRILYDAAS